MLRELNFVNRPLERVNEFNTLISVTILEDETPSLIIYNNVYCQNKLEDFDKQ